MSNERCTLWDSCCLLAPPHPLPNPPTQTTRLKRALSCLLRYSPFGDTDDEHDDGSQWGADVNASAVESGMPDLAMSCMDSDYNQNGSYSGRTTGSRKTSLTNTCPNASHSTDLAAHASNINARDVNKLIALERSVCSNASDARQQTERSGARQQGLVLIIWIQINWKPGVCDSRSPLGPSALGFQLESPSRPSPK